MGGFGPFGSKSGPGNMSASARLAPVKKKTFARGTSIVSRISGDDRRPSLIQSIGMDLNLSTATGKPLG